MKEFVESLQAFLTPIIAIAVAWIAFQQWKTAQQKLKMERYERRMRVYDQVIQILKVVMRDMNPKYEDLIQFRQATTEADFLFGSEIPDYLDELVSNGIKLQNAKGAYCDYTRISPPGYDHTKVVNEIKTQAEWFTDQFNGAREKFRPYLDIGHDTTAADVNWIRGFRGIGWVITFPLAAIIVIAFYEETKEFSPSYYYVQQRIDYYALAKKTGTARTGTDLLGPIKNPFEYELELPGMGTATFSNEIPKEIAAKMLKDFLKHHPDGIKPWEIDWSLGGAPPPGFVLDKSVPITAGFIAPKKVNRLKLAGWIIGSFVGMALVIQGSISVLAWIGRGFIDK